MNPGLAKIDIWDFLAAIKVICIPSTCSGNTGGIDNSIAVKAIKEFYGWLVVTPGRAVKFTPRIFYVFNFVIIGLVWLRYVSAITARASICQFL